MRPAAGTPAPRRPGYWCTLLLMPILLAACGQTGPLTLPEQPAETAGAGPDADAASDPQPPDRASGEAAEGEAVEPDPGEDDGN